MAGRTSLLLVVVSAFAAIAPRSARAQVPVPVDTLSTMQTASSEPATPLVLNGPQLVPGVSLYRSSVITDTTAQPMGDIMMSVTATTYGDSASWLLLANGRRGTLDSADSLWVEQSTLRPRHWSAALGPSRLAAEFARDTVFVATSSPLGKQSLSLATEPRLLVNPAMVDAALSLLPLQPGWSDSVSMIVVDVGGAAVVPARLYVEGEEWVSVPAGLFDAWLVVLQTERAEGRFWVRKDSQMVVKSRQILPQLNGAVLERVLLATAPVPSPIPETIPDSLPPLVPVVPPGPRVP